MIGEHLVPDIPAAAKGFLEQFLLLRCGIKADLDGVVLDHPARFGMAVLLFLFHGVHPSPAFLHGTGGPVPKGVPLGPAL